MSLILYGQLRNAFFKIAHDAKEYETNISPTDEFIEKLSARDIDIFTFLERKWCCPIPNPPSTWIKKEDNVALLEIKNFDTWWSDVGKKTVTWSGKQKKRRKSNCCGAK